MRQAAVLGWRAISCRARYSPSWWCAPGLLRDPAFEAGARRADPPQPALFSECAGSARPQGCRPNFGCRGLAEAKEVLAPPHLDLGRGAERIACAGRGRVSGRARELRTEFGAAGTGGARPSRLAAGPPARPRGRGKDAPGDPAGALGNADLRARRRSDRHRRGQPRRRDHGRRQYPCLWSFARPSARRRRRRYRGAKSFAAASRPSSSVSPGIIWSANKCLRQNGDFRCRSALVDDRLTITRN